MASLWRTRAEDPSTTGPNTRTQPAWKASRNTPTFTSLFYSPGAQAPARPCTVRNERKWNVTVATAKSFLKFQVLSSDFFLGIIPRLLFKYPMSMASYNMVADAIPIGNQKFLPDPADYVMPLKCKIRSNPATCPSPGCLSISIRH